MKNTSKATKFATALLLLIICSLAPIDITSPNTTTNDEYKTEQKQETKKEDSKTESSKETATEATTTETPKNSVTGPSALSLNDIPEWTEGSNGYITVNDNVPNFTEDQITNVSYEIYSDLDSLGRVGVAEACLGRDLMPTSERGDISSVHPSGWYSLKSQLKAVGQYANRGHLIAFSLAGENANEKNLASMTAYCNQKVFTEFEEKVRDYIYQTNNHVMYRVTPFYDGNDLIAKGFEVEAYSVEDGGNGVMFNVYCYNVQPKLVINYRG